MKQVLGGVGAIIVTVAIIVGLCVGGWFLYWKLTASSVNRQGEIRQNTYGRQVGLVSGIDKNTSAVADIDVQITIATGDQLNALKAQRKAIVGQVCSDAANLNGTVDPSTSASKLIQQEC
jgi:preprotein translocase subunit YajC